MKIIKECSLRRWPLLELLILKVRYRKWFSCIILVITILLNSKLWFFPTANVDSLSKFCHHFSFVCSVVMNDCLDTLGSLRIPVDFSRWLKPPPVAISPTYNYIAASVFSARWNISFSWCCKCTTTTTFACQYGCHTNANFLSY